MAVYSEYVGMGRRKNLILWPLLLLIVAYHPMGTAGNTGTFHYQNETGNYPFAVKQTGDNYTFEFDNYPGIIGKKLKAAVHVLQSVYEDSSINPSYSETFMKESAQCFVFDASFYSYRACFLPNDYSPGNRERFWGFVTQLPNAAWLITRNLLPALFGIGLFFYLLKKT
jgi:hypothetical protein